MVLPTRSLKKIQGCRLGWAMILGFLVKGCQLFILEIVSIPHFFFASRT